MEFTLSPEQRSRIAEAVSLARSALTDNAPAAATTLDRLAVYGDRWAACRRAHLTGLPFPERLGGRSIGLLDCCLVFEAMAEAGADPGFIFSLGVNQFAVGVALWTAGSEDQQQEWVPAIARGDRIGALAVSELEAGSDSYAMATSARETAAGFVLDGSKTWITNAPVADVILVLARTDDLPGAFGISAFLVPVSTPGVEIADCPQKAGLRGAPWGTVTFRSAVVPAGAMIGGRGAGGAVFQDAMRWERCGLFAILLGAMRRNFVETLAHVRDRRQFGRALVENDVVCSTIARMRMRIEASHLMLMKAAASIDRGEPDDVAISLAKAQVSEAAVENAVAAQGLFGAAGILDDSHASKFLRDVMPFRMLSGPNEIQYRIATRHLLAELAQTRSIGADVE